MVKFFFCFELNKKNISMIINGEIIFFKIKGKTLKKIINKSLDIVN